MKKKLIITTKQLHYFGAICIRDIIKEFYSDYEIIIK